jgi:hypothetical protein
MIDSSGAAGYSSPYSLQFLQDYKQAETLRIAVTQENIVAMKETIQKNIDPELLKVFNAGSVVDVFA